MKYCFIINPAAGKAATKEGLEDKISECAARRGVDVIVKHTQKAGDTQRYIAELARELDGEELYVYVCGGDGTVCEAVNGIMSIPERSNIALGVIPVGTGNDLVRNFGSKDICLDICAQLDATPFEVDIIKCNDFYCMNMINVGFDCQVVVKTAKIKKRRLIPSKLAYICGLVITLIKKPGAAMRVVNDGKEEHRELLLATFANGSFCGGGFHSNPRACLCDGKIDALFVNDISRTKFVSIVGEYKKGTHISEKNAKLLVSEKSESYKLIFDAPTVISVDGELVTLTEANISCLSGALRVLIPSGCEYAKAPLREEATV